MKRQLNDTDLLLLWMAVGYTINLCMGIAGSFFPPDSYWQMTLWQIGDSMAIMGSVLASRHIGARGESIAAAGFTMLAIAYGVSFASSNMDAVNETKMATVILPLVPALFLISYGRLFPMWLKIAAVCVCIPFFFMYRHVQQGTYAPDDISNALAYSGIQVLGVLWAMYMLLDHKKSKG